MSENNKELSAAILSFSDWSTPWKFEEFVSNELQTEEDKQQFETIWKEALKFENWNYSDLAVGITKTAELLSARFVLESEVARQIARAAAYQWK